jgi:SAM-dependent methyltransferase
MLERFHLDSSNVFECGCGQGEFLLVWNEFPVKAFGIENSPSLVATARAQGLSVEQGFIDNSSSPLLKQGPFSAFTSFNFLEHQPDPNGMLQAIYNNLTRDGVGLITVPSLEYILKNDAYYELIVDHLVYFSRKTFTSILERNGFKVVYYDNYLEDTHCAYVMKETKFNVNGLQACKDKLDKELSGFVGSCGTSKGHIAVWGASHQGFTILSSAGVDKSVSFIIDSAPFKQNRYSPVSHLKIFSPEVLKQEPMAAVIIIAPSYSEEIYKSIREIMELDCPVAIIKKGCMEIRRS